MKNLGVKLESIKPQDWIAGGFTPLSSKDIVPDGQWDKYLPVIEYQNRSFDRMACISYSLLNPLEMQYLAKTGKEINFSDRFLAKMSNTQHWGNYVSTVFDTARRFGLVEESVYPDVLTDWDDYYKDIPEDVILKAGDFLLQWDMYREYILPQHTSEIIASLRQTPLQVLVKYASGPGILYPSGKYNHAVTLYGYQENEFWKIFDHYEGAIKRYDWDYQFGTILKPTLLSKNIPMKFKQNHLYLLVEGNEQKLGMFLDNKIVIYDDKVDAIINSSSRLRRYEVAVPTTMVDWNSVPHVNGRGDKIE